ncbi:hypothetical protein MSG28_003121 [Choristoneura fumiferana]|uniref:Uncharacterized protein n=1 Tax=Choristoneura fumiferana TaxID=7141 RepID=A0ACC0KDP6_CHOFU|nr:hypothetical protein MSG28_003121 [Choristoneura fumiferana]
MTSMASDNESNVSAFIRCNDQNITQLYMSAIENMESINLDLQQVENNLKRIVNRSGPLESQLNALLRTLPEPNLQLHMETE